ncbi:receptor-type tyrosine-protein phosphatase S-like, partial [Notechis scutatus]|uniref:Receptor-type tyrosine-protein phosphatase S-like n=1 Tax=Notechis scutatus TaxID=8663 RepID=A0A6J1WA52_9SAUR
PGQPMNFRAEAKSESTILLTWSPPRQDIILKYELLYKEISNKPGTPEFLKTFDPVTFFLVKDLNPNTEYVFQLAARSALGLGAPTSEVRERTLQSSRCPFSYPEFSEGITVRQEAQRLGVEVWNGDQ